MRKLGLVVRLRWQKRLVWRWALRVLGPPSYWGHYSPCSLCCEACRHLVLRLSWDGSKLLALQKRPRCECFGHKCRQKKAQGLRGLLRQRRLSVLVALLLREGAEVVDSL